MIREARIGERLKHAEKIRDEMASIEGRLLPEHTGALEVLRWITLDSDTKPEFSLEDYE